VDLAADRWVFGCCSTKDKAVMVQLWIGRLFSNEIIAAAM
jgi:hypothetical protein